MSLIDRLKRVWDAVYDPNRDVVEVIETYFHPDYKQCINGVVMHRDEYIDHVIAQCTLCCGSQFLDGPLAL